MHVVIFVTLHGQIKGTFCHTWFKVDVADSSLNRHIKTSKMSYVQLPTGMWYKLVVTQA